MTIYTDKDGFLKKESKWDLDIAKTLAKREGIDKLDQEGKEILLFLRSYFEKHHNFPILANVCKKVGGRRDCVTSHFTNPMKAWKIAGLPKPPHIFFSSFDGKKYIPNPVY